MLFGTDTAAANTLDDYETGTWTPAFVGGTKTATIRRAVYVKIGSLVFIQCFLSSLAGGDGTSLSLSGLPFTSITDGYAVGSIQYGSGTQLAGSVARMNSGTNKLAFKYGVNDDNIIQTDVGNFLMVSLTYDVV